MVISYDEFQRIYNRLKGEPEFKFTFMGSIKEYMIIKLNDGQATFQRCGDADGSREVFYSSLDELYHAKTVDGICLAEDWDKIDGMYVNDAYNLSERLEKLYLVRGVASIDIDRMVEMVIERFKIDDAVLDMATDPDEGILGHIFGNYAISLPMMELYYKDREKYGEYCKLVEELWLNGDDKVQNIVDVTILEDLNTCGDENVWKGLAEYIGDDFKNYINWELLYFNVLMNKCRI